jgi:gas vesicle protein
MSDEKNPTDVASAQNHEDKHPFALGVLTGAAVGAGVALLFTPRTGAQMRHEIGHQWTRAKGNCSTSYQRAKGAASHWSERGRHAYDVTRIKVSDGARETRQYVREVSDALTRRAHKEAASAANEDFAAISC